MAMKLLVLDGNSILNRAFYGIRLLTTKEGIYTNGIYGFLSIYQRLCDEVSPDAVAAAFDLRAPTFRHKMYDGYKAGRKGMPEELASQLPVLKELRGYLGVSVVECEGYEADDILGTLSTAAATQGHDCVIATGDRDSLQLVGPGVTVLLAATKAGQPELRRYDMEKIKEDYGLSPGQLIDVKALQGDASDHIPGVAGIGQKTALDLIQRFENIDKIYSNLDSLEIRETLRAKLRDGEEQARMSYQLGKIVTDVPINTDLPSYTLRESDRPRLAGLLAKLEFFKWIDRWNLSEVTPVAQTEETSPAKEIPCELAGDLAALAASLNEGACFLGAWEGDRLLAVAIAREDQVTLAQREQEGWGELMRILASLPGTKTHDSKLFYRECAALGLDLATVEIRGFDTMLAAYLLNPAAASYPLERLVQEYAVSVPAVTGVPEKWETLCKNAAALPGLCQTLSERIEQEGQEELLRSIELPLARVLAAMELDGFLVDAPGIESFGKVLESRIAEIEAEIYRQVGEEFNINSPKQLGHALFEVLGLPAKKKTKSGYSTSAEVLEGLKYEHPAVELLLEYRQLTKLKSTYCDGLTAAIGSDGRIHSTLHQTETRTGRISSAEPNLQNIPVRKELGREMRRFFTAREGWVLCDADYSQIELRLLAAIAGDSSMIEAFQRGDDIHAITASQVFGMPLEMVTPLMRSRAKAVNFGIVYGIGAFSLSKDLGIAFGEAKRYIEGYMSTYPGVRDYMERTVNEAKEKGYAETMFGRRRPLPELASSNAALRSFGERVARNMPIQGTAADVSKIAMVRVWDRLRREGLRARLILQVHDELIVEAPEAEAERVCSLLREEMEGALAVAVPLTADVHSGKTWFDVKE